MHTDDDKQTAGDKRIAPSASSQRLWGQFFRVLRLTARRDVAQRRRALARAAESDPAGLAGWALANDLWMRGDISAAYRKAQEVLRGDPTDFGMLLICLDYHIRARDSAQIYVFAERLIAAKNPAHHLRLMHAVESLFLWPLWLLGFRFGSLNKHANNLDRWVSWARNYLASHPPQIVAGDDPVGGDHPPAEIPAKEIEGSQVWKTTWSVMRIILLILLIAAVICRAVLVARKSSRVSEGSTARVCPVGPSGSYLCTAHDNRLATDPGTTRWTVQQDLPLHGRKAGPGVPLPATQSGDVEFGTTT